MSDEEKKSLIWNRDYQKWKNEEVGKYFLLVVYIDDDGTDPDTALIDIPIAMQQDGLTERVWKWLATNRASDVESPGPAPKWLDGIRADEVSTAFTMLRNPIISSPVVMAHVHTTFM